MGPGGPPRGFMGPQERAREKLKIMLKGDFDL